LAQAEAEYKDFILFYPAMEEAAESQWKVCQIHYKQMEKADRDSNQAIRTEDECRALVTQFPNSKFVPGAQQMLRNTQEVLAEKEFRTGAFYHTKGSFPAAANRLSFVADQYPLYSGAAEALWQAADSFKRMGDRFEDKAAADYARIVRDYPLSPHSEEAKDALIAMKRPVPAADPGAIARMKYEDENRPKSGMLKTGLGVLKRGPDVRTAAKTGPPAMQSLRPPTPVSVPAAAAGPAIGSDVSVTLGTNSTDLDTKPDARQNQNTATPGAGAAANPNAAGEGAAATGTTGTPAAAAAAQSDQQQPLPSNRQPIQQKKKKQKKAKPAAAATTSTTTTTTKTPADQPKQQ
jgi:outer membrane protein assembly factor BamD